ncbi:MAG: NAD(P)/FAD-dependent oxidoreductase [Bryobacterales bacterium]|nr:NAD(P)/FAD-dependent oxidoreductase [Bryobacterales bacterium]
MGKRAVIIGAGPGGLTAARELHQLGVPSTLLEKESQVGGLAKTVRREGYHFDLGGHRFFTKVKLIERIWHETLGDALLTRPRLSRIFYNKHFFHYPLRPADALRKLGIWEAGQCMTSFAAAKVFPQRREEDLESWLINRFGERLYRTFFKTYTEKVWGIPCDQISADWAGQRIKGLDMITLLRNALGLTGKGGGPKTLIDQFLYPRFGPGMLWERMTEQLEAAGSEVKLEHPVEAIRWQRGGVTSVVAGGKTYAGTHFLSTMPVKELIEALDPAPPAEVREAARFFSYRDFLTVGLVLDGRDFFPDNWIYIHEPEVKVGRIQNFGNWSADMVGRRNVTCLGMEYFCFEGDGLWSMPDADLVNFAKQELEKIGLGRADKVIKGWAIRVPKAYPVYDGQYQEGLRRVRAFLEQVPNLQLLGRNGMHRYNNMDHSMLTGILAARNILGSRYDLWKVNADAEYLEEGADISAEELHGLEQTQPLVPGRVSTAPARLGA